MFENLIQDRLAAMFGLEVTFGDLDVAPLKGAVHARNLRAVSPASSTPLFEASEVHGEISPAALLHRRIDVRRIAVQQPAVHVVRSGDGTWNLPARKAREKRSNASASFFQLDVQTASLSEGTFELRDERPSAIFDTARISALQARLDRVDDAYHFAITGGDVVIHTGGESISLGPLKINGALRGESLTKLSEAGVTCELTLGEMFRAGIEAPKLSERAATAAVQGEIDLALLRRFVPMAVLPGMLANGAWSGRCRFDCQLSFGAAEGLRIHDLALTAKDLRIG